MQSLALESQSGRKAKELEGILGWLRSSHTLFFCRTVWVVTLLCRQCWGNLHCVSGPRCRSHCSAWLLNKWVWPFLTWTCGDRRKGQLTKQHLEIWNLKATAAPPVLLCQCPLSVSHSWGKSEWSVKLGSLFHSGSRLKRVEFTF